MELDDSGFPRPTGRLETLTADTLILALGQETDTGFLRQVPGVEFGRDGTVQVSSSLMTGCPGVFAGGDMVPAERTVTVGVGHGKKAARHIDAWLRGDAPRPRRPSTNWRASACSTCGTSVTPPRGSSRRPPRTSASAGFGEVVGGLTEKRLSTRPGGACPAATAASATAAWARARRTR